MNRSIISAAVIAVLASASLASAEQSKPAVDFTANAASPADLPAAAANEVRSLVGDADLTGLTTADVGAIEAALYSDDSNRGATIRGILADEPVVEVSRSANPRLFQGGDHK